jgi:AraC-like DNA-binding protein
MTAHLAGSNFSVDSVAERAGIGLRTLQRRLQSEGASFRDIRSLVLRKRAQALLTETSLSVSDIAAALGFDEVNSFRRAFLDWTGFTPTEFVRHLKGRGAIMDLSAFSPASAGAADA